MDEIETTIPDAGHETTDIGPRVIVWGLILLVGSLLAITMGAILMFPRSLHDRTLNLPLPAYPAPQLQPSPPEDMARFRAAELEKSNGVYWIDRAHGVLHIPIDDAMRIVAQDGIPGWPAGKTP